ncbi:MAG TPA: winged helix-turn-helix domain-containing protein [Terriglobales bacterium]|nr:winged helix-turn-helix domain-containing protein [Terriglobales bacterium]
MQEAIGRTAGAIWQSLNEHGELSLPTLKKRIDAKSPVFDWAIGWLAREDKLVITPHQKSYHVRLNDAQGRTAGA